MAGLLDEGSGLGFVEEERHAGHARAAGTRTGTVRGLQRDDGKGLAVVVDLDGTRRGRALVQNQIAVNGIKAQGRGARAMKMLCELVGGVNPQDGLGVLGEGTTWKQRPRLDALGGSGRTRSGRGAATKGGIRHVRGRGTEGGGDEGTSDDLG